MNEITTLNGNKQINITQWHYEKILEPQRARARFEVPSKIVCHYNALKTQLY